jgi:hypothetical protein
VGLYQSRLLAPFRGRIFVCALVFSAQARGSGRRPRFSIPQKISRLGDLCGAHLRVLVLAARASVSSFDHKAGGCELILPMKIEANSCGAGLGCTLCVIVGLTALANLAVITVRNDQNFQIQMAHQGLVACPRDAANGWDEWDWRPKNACPEWSSTPSGLTTKVARPTIVASSSTVRAQRSIVASPTPILERSN